MRNATSLASWDAALETYLASRRALGRAYDGEERVLRTLRASLVRLRRADLDATSFERWRAEFDHCSANTRRDYAMMVFRFCRYRRRRDPACFLPDRATFERRRPYPLPSPVEEGQVAQLLRFLETSGACGARPLRRPALRLAILLMYTAGLRRGEVARLRLEDVEPASGVLRIRASKFHKSRWVPLSTSTTRELRRYLQARRAVVPQRGSATPLLWSCATRAYTPEGLSNAVKALMLRSGIWNTAPRLARVHDFRHGFAVAALRRWYEAGADVQSELPKLAMYMGHVSIASTVYYLRYMPAVVALAAERFARSCSDLIEGGTP